MVGDGVPHHGLASLVQALTALAFASPVRASDAVLFFNVVALSALVIVVIDVGIVGSFGMEWSNFSHWFYPFFDVASQREHLSSN